MYLTKKTFYNASLTLAAGLLASSIALAQQATIALPTGELGATSYDPVKASKLNSAASLIYDRLVEQDADQSYHPHLATSWQESSDGMSWTFKLKSGVKFHDGSPFNAQTIADWIPDFAGTDNAYLVEAIDRVEVIDDLTVKFVMKRPEPNLLYNLASTFMGIPSQRAVDKLGDKFGVTDAVGTGPFKLSSFAIGLETVLTKNEDYAWGSDLSQNQGAAYLDKVTFREIPDQSTAFLEMKTGGVDLLLGVPTDFLEILGQEQRVKVIQMAGTGINYMPINTTAAPFDDILVRQATGLAINQQSILDAVYKGVGSVAKNFLISSLPEADVSAELNAQYDPQKAGQLLDQAGWKMTDSGVRMKGDKALQVKLYTSNSTEFKRLTQVVQAQLKAIGMDAVITVFDSSTIRDEYKRNTHQLAVRGYDWNNSDILDWFFSGNRLGYPNVSMWKDPKGQALNDKAMKQSATFEQRIANFKSYHEYVLSQHLFVPLYQPATSIAFNKETLSVPQQVRGTRFRSQTVMDIKALN